MSTAYTRGPCSGLGLCALSACLPKRPGACVEEDSEGHWDLVVCPWQRQRCGAAKPGFRQGLASGSPRGRADAATFLWDSVPKATLYQVVSRSEPTECVL